MTVVLGRFDCPWTLKGVSTGKVKEGWNGSQQQWRTATSKKTVQSSMTEDNSFCHSYQTLTLLVQGGGKG